MASSRPHLTGRQARGDSGGTVGLDERVLRSSPGLRSREEADHEQGSGHRRGRQQLGCRCGEGKGYRGRHEGKDHRGLEFLFSR